MGGSQVYLEVGETMSVEDLLKSICIASANDAMVAMAEKIGGTHAGFVEMMTRKRKSWGSSTRISPMPAVCTIQIITAVPETWRSSVPPC